MSIGRSLHEVAVVTSLGLRTLPQRATPVLVATLGMLGVVAVFVAVLSVAEGFRATLAAAGAPELAMVMRAGSDTEMSSFLSGEDARLVANAPGVRRDDGGALSSAELFVVVDMPKKSTDTIANVPLRGVQPAAFRVHEKVHIISGRLFEPGRNELIVGEAASRQFAGLEIGNTITWSGNPWTVVGVFGADGSLAESELWCDLRVLQGLYHRGNSVQSVMVRLTSAELFPEFKDALTADPRLNVKVLRADAYYADQSQAINAVITGIGYFVVMLMGIGAVFGALNTMYSAVAARSREIAVLRALGFSASAIVVSVLTEALLIGAIGGLFGGWLAYVVFNGYQAATLNFQSFSQVVFTFSITPAIVKQGVACALVMGLIGGFFPALRAARLPVATALREP